MKKLILLLLGFCLLAPAMAQEDETATEEGVQFIMEDWDAAVAKAKAEGKHILFDAYTDWCYWCKVQDRETFADPAMAAFIEEHFVSLKVNMEEGIGIKLAAKFRVGAYPTLLIFNPQGQLVHTISGYIEDHARFKQELQVGLDFPDERRYAYDSQELDPGFPEWYVASYDPKQRRSLQVSEEQVTEFLASREDMYDEVSWSVISSFPTGAEYQEFLFENSDEYAERFGESEVVDVLGSKIRQLGAKAASEGNQEIFEEALDLADAHLGENAGWIKLTMKANYYSKTGDWKMYTMTGLEAKEQLGIEGAIGLLNSFGWNLYLECEDQECLEKAATWMKEVVGVSPSFAYLDTYAALLYKTKAYAEAKIQAERAIAVGKENEENVEETENLLASIEQAIAGE